MLLLKVQLGGTAVRKKTRRTIFLLFVTSLLIVAISAACTTIFNQLGISHALDRTPDSEQVSNISPEESKTSEPTPTPDEKEENQTEPSVSEEGKKGGQNNQNSGNPSNNPAGKPAPNSGASQPKEEPPSKELIEKYTQELVNYRGLPYFNDEYSDRYVLYKIKKPDYPFEKVITYVNIGLDKGFYKHVNVISNITDLTVLVNKFHKLPDNFKPQLVQLDPSLCVEGRGPQFMHPDAAQAFIKMHEDAKLLGLNITAYGTYRSIETQNAIWNRAVNSGRTIEDVDSLNARGGHSEHHTGLAIDVIKNNYSVENTPEFKWYRENAHKYGFIIRYPKDKESITGYKYEPWHLRYVGDIAEDVYNSGLTYEEYYITVLEPQSKN